MKDADTVFTILQQMLDSSPEASFKRLNPALRDTLANCIAADLPFQPDTFQRICKELRGGWWFGDGAGSSIGEGFYSIACDCNHASAQKSFEQFAERPGVLWEQDAATPERLHVGSNLSWKGYYLEVTSMQTDKLVACSYRDVRERARGLKAGATIGYDPEWLIVSSKSNRKATTITVVKAPEDRGSRVVAKRFSIPYAEIAEFRRTESARVKKVIAEIASCETGEFPALAKKISESHFRHFQLEAINAAFSKRREKCSNQERIAAWRSGANGAWLEVDDILLRVREDLVECSNGNSVSLAAARRALPVVMERRKLPGLLDLSLDGYTVNEASAKGVRIGCTLVPWPEVELLAKAI